MHQYNIMTAEQCLDGGNGETQTHPLDAASALKSRRGLVLLVSQGRRRMEALINGRVLRDTGALGALHQLLQPPHPIARDVGEPSAFDDSHMLSDFYGVPVRGRNTELQMRGKAGSHQLLRKMDIRRSAT